MVADREIRFGRILRRVRTGISRTLGSEVDRVGKGLLLGRRSARLKIGGRDLGVGGGRGRHDLLAGQSGLAGSVPVVHDVPLDGDGELGEIARDVLQIFEGPDRYRLRPEAPEVEPAFDLDDLPADLDDRSGDRRIDVDIGDVIKGGQNHARDVRSWLQGRELIERGRGHAVVGHDHALVIGQGRGRVVVAEEGVSPIEIQRCQSRPQVRGLDRGVQVLVARGLEVLRLRSGVVA